VNLQLKSIDQQGAHHWPGEIASEFHAALGIGGDVVAIDIGPTGLAKYFVVLDVVRVRDEVAQAKENPPAARSFAPTLSASAFPLHQSWMKPRRAAMANAWVRSWAPNYTKQSTGREFIWDFTEETRRIRGVIPGLPIPAAQFEEIIATCRDLDGQGQPAKLVQLTVKKA
jgi:hypothetical protein